MNKMIGRNATRTRPTAVLRQAFSHIKYKAYTANITAPEYIKYNCLQESYKTESKTTTVTTGAIKVIRYIRLFLCLLFCKKFLGLFKTFFIRIKIPRKAKAVYNMGVVIKNQTTE